MAVDAEAGEAGEATTKMTVAIRAELLAISVFTLTSYLRNNFTGYCWDGFRAENLQQSNTKCSRLQLFSVKR